MKKMDKPRKLTNPATLRAILDGFIQDYEAMEQHVTGQDLHTQHLHNRVVHLKELMRMVLISHQTGESKVAERLRKKLTQEVQKDL